ncbi:hypothetical protein M9H77_18147 [Catharanthus roseus]|uniref:Uncharacterized protein n=1 Tax=Catharanthus roseus TaxID=4058 RepID=A0ACC0B6M0_CATRO|nr:hypothetical protein M9H77_18147 [Catharanthus roseus]
MTAPPGFQSQRHVPPHPPQIKTQILDSHTQSIAKLETQIGQLANAISRKDEGRLPSHSIENPRANYHEQAKAVITLRNGEEDNKIRESIKDNKLNENETEEIDIETKIEKKVEKELASSSKSKTPEPSLMTSYKPKTLNLALLGGNPTFFLFTYLFLNQPQQRIEEAAAATGIEAAETGCNSKKLQKLKAEEVATAGILLK